jgi:hypothetical protein
LYSIHHTTTTANFPIGQRLDPLQESAMASSLQQIANSITERSRTLINNDLKKICKEEGTSQTGNKAALQSRVVGRKCFSRLRFLCLSRSRSRLLVCPTTC